MLKNRRSLKRPNRGRLCVDLKRSSSLMERVMWDDEECRERQVGTRTLASSWALVAVILLAAAVWSVLGRVVQ